jgi:amino acid adenylation domain-containing protein/FkbM family methyltransferase
MVALNGTLRADAFPGGLPDPFAAFISAGSLPCLHQLFEEQVLRTPDDTALFGENGSLTYRELDRRAGRLAHELRAREVGRDSRVGLFLERSPEMVTGMLGILKAGGAYVPIDAAYPDVRIAYILEDAGVGVLLTQGSLLPRLPSDGPEPLCLDDFDWTSGGDPGPLDPAVEPDDLAYVIYTSGSTGRPKGVCVEHRNIVSYTLGAVERLRFEPGMSYALVSTIAADLGNTVIFPALVTGGCLHVISRERGESQAQLSEYFERHGIDVLKIAPSHLAALQSGRDPERVMPRKRLVLGGEPSALERIEQLRALSPTCEIYNHYGPTEATVGVLTYRVGEKLPATPSGMLPLGAPLPNARIHILALDGRPAREGEQGELCIGGAGVARGYLNRPELTAEKFMQDPFGPASTSRLYRTGDLARRLADGSIEFCGRIDSQVKLGGYRVELGEIEQALRELPGVKDAVVLARDDPAGGKQLAAYVVPEQAAQPLWDFPSIHVLPDGSPVAHLNRNETDYIYNEIFVLQAYLRNGIVIRDGDCIVDAGANIGLFSVFAGRLARNLRILAFEPNPAAFACLKANAAASGASVHCRPCGLSHESTSADLTFFEGMSLLSGFYADAATERSVVERYVLNQVPLPGGDPGMAGQLGQLIDGRLRSKTISAQLRTLSSIIAEEGIDRIDLLKINVEKSELDVLRGLGGSDWPKIRQLVVEVDRSSNLEPIVSLLGHQGFEVLIEQDALLDKTELCYVYALRPADGRRLARQASPAEHVRPVPGPDARILAPAVLRRHLGERLPRYMVPQGFKLMERLPLMLNGKVDRQGLPPCESLATAAGYLGPRTDTERAVAAIWSELLPVRNVGVNDDFFDLGGQSLMAIKMVSRLRDVFDVDVQLRNLFERPTVAGLAEIVDGLSWSRGGCTLPPGSGEREEMAF